MPGRVPGIHVLAARANKVVDGRNKCGHDEGDIMAEIRVPVLGESVTEATLGEWLKQPGDPVKADEPVASLETDKVSIEVPSPNRSVRAEPCTSRPVTSRAVRTSAPNFAACRRARSLSRSRCRRTRVLSGPPAGRAS